MARKKQTYEEMIAKLEDIATSLESGEVSVEQAVSLYKEGMELAILCRQKLDTAQKDVMILKKQFDNSFSEDVFDRNEEIL